MELSQQQYWQLQLANSVSVTFKLDEEGRWRRLSTQWRVHLLWWKGALYQVWWSLATTTVKDEGAVQDLSYCLIRLSLLCNNWILLSFFIKLRLLDSNLLNMATFSSFCSFILLIQKFNCNTVDHKISKYRILSIPWDHYSKTKM